MRRQQYLALVLFAILTITAGCSALGLGQATPTPIPFDRYSAQNVINAFARAGLPVQNPEKATTVLGRGAPTGFRDRYLFEVPRIAPAGGQIIEFATPAELQAWQDYIQQLSSSSATRRDVIYVYVQGNIMLQLNANLTTQEANAYRDALAGM